MPCFTLIVLRWARRVFVSGGLCRAQGMRGLPAGVQKGPGAAPPASRCFGRFRASASGSVSGNGAWPL